MQSVPIAINVHCGVYSIQHYAIKFVSDLWQTGWWFSPGTPVSSIIKTGRHDITEILLKVAVNTINQTISHQSVLRTFHWFFCYYMTILQNLILDIINLKLDVCCILFCFFFVGDTQTSNDFSNRVTSGLIFSNDQSTVNLLNL